VKDGACQWYRKDMNPPVQKGERVVVGGNLQRYATAIVSDCAFVPTENRWAIALEWPNIPPELGASPGHSRVWSTDEGKVWYRYAQIN